MAYVTDLIVDRSIFIAVGGVLMSDGPADIDPTSVVLLGRTTVIAVKIHLESRKKQQTS